MFKDHTLRPLFDRFFDKDEETTDIDVLPIRAAGDAACPPDSISSPTLSKISEHIDMIRLGVEDILLSLIYDLFKSYYPSNNFISWGLVDASFDVASGIDSSQPFLQL